MRLTQKKLEEILVNILGEAGLPLIRELVGKENVSEFDLAKKTNSDIKIIRKLLYMLYNENLVSFTRKKDKQKGWYIYYWTLEAESIRFNYFKMKRNLLERLQRQLDLEEKEIFFICPNNCVRLDFDQSMEFEFHCPECGELITQDDKEKRITMLQKKIKETSEELKKLEEARKARRIVIKEKQKEVAKRKVEKKKTVTKAKKPAAKKKAPAKKAGKKVTTKKTSTKAKKPATKEAKKVVKKKTTAKKKEVKKKAVAKKRATTKTTAKKTTTKKATKKPVAKKVAKKTTTKKKK